MPGSGVRRQRHDFLLRGAGAVEDSGLLAFVQHQNSIAAL